MKRLIPLILMLLLFGACKTQTAVAPLVIRDSISITYKQGQEQPTPIGVKGAPTAFRRNSSAPAFGKVGLGATREASVSEEALSERTNKLAVPPTTRIRVDTVFVERWHTQYLPEPAKPIPRFYKDCTWGFFILLLLILGRIALRITKAVRL